MEQPLEFEIEEAEGEDLGPAIGAAALSLPGSSRDKVVNAKTAAFLDEQTAVLRLQKEHLHEQRELQLSHLKWRRFSDWMKAALQLSTALVAVAIAAGLGAAVLDATRADSVVVDSFQTPPALAAEGLNGVVLASKLQDQLQRLQAETRSDQAKRGVKDAWSGDIKLEVPETGVSIGDLVSVLHRWLGHETHIGGDLEAVGDDVSLTVRGEGFEARTFEGKRLDLPKLLTQAAEYLYGESEPFLAASYLITHGRNAEALELAKAKFGTVKRPEQALLLNDWGNALANTGDLSSSLSKYQQAITLNPKYWPPYNNVMNTDWALGREEDAWRVGKTLERQLGRGGAIPAIAYENFDVLDWDLPSLMAGQIADLKVHGGAGGAGVTQDGPTLAEAAVKMHDPQAAELYLQTSFNASKDPWVLAMGHFVHGWAALDRGDASRAEAELEAFAVAYADPTIGFENPGYDCWLAPAEEMAGRPDKADAAVKAGGRFVDCYRFKADILDHRGEWAGAQRAYADAVALAPDLPAAWYSWGLALARHGDLADAQAKLAAANARGPHWADPLKAWGDVLATQHRWAVAEAKYAEAAKYAPKWLALRMAWGNALKSEGKSRDAIVQYRAVSEAAGHG